MDIVLKSGRSSAVVSTIGACVRSLVFGGRETVVDKGCREGGGIDSVLFPIVGRLKDGIYEVGGKTFALPLHGLLKSADMTVSERSEDSVTLCALSDADTLSQYPYDFGYTVRYELFDNALREKHTIVNTGKETMYYAFGLHPSFLLDGAKHGKTNTGTDILSFGREISPSLWRLNDAGHFVVGKESFPSLCEIAADKRTVSEYGTLMLADEELGSVKLFARSGRVFAVRTSPSPTVLALWGEPEGEEGYICVEPWWGMPDLVEPISELKDKTYINALPAGESAVYELTAEEIS